MGKKARKLRSPKYARKASALRATVARLRGQGSASNTVAIEEKQKVPNALKTLKTEEAEKTETATTEQNNTTPNKNTKTTTKKNTTRKTPAKRTRRTRKKTTTSTTKKTAKKTN